MSKRLAFEVEVPKKADEAGDDRETVKDECDDADDLELV